jgi:hypothetical protein
MAAEGWCMLPRGDQFLTVETQCRACGRDLPSGMRAYLDAAGAHCAGCAPQGSEAPAREATANLRLAHVTYPSVRLVTSGAPQVGPLPAEGPERAHIARARRDNLFAALTDNGSPDEAWLCAADGMWALTRLLDELVPAGVVVLHDRRLPDRPVLFRHLVVARRGVVVVDGVHQRHLVRRSPSGSRRAGPVRDAVRRAVALRRLLVGSAWEGVPVNAAVCLIDSDARYTSRPLSFGDVWVGRSQYVLPWIASGHALRREQRRQLGDHLDALLPLP